MTYREKNLILIILLINCGLSFSQERVIDDYYNLNGRIKTIKSDSYLAKPTSQGLVKVKKGWEEAEKYDELIEFNEYGKETKISYIDIDSNIRRIDRYQYNGDRLMKSFTKYQKVKYSYDNLGRIESEKGYDRTPDIITASNIDETTEKAKFIIKNKYRDDHQIEEKTEYDSKGNVTEKTYYSYNESGLLIKEENVSKGYKDWYVFVYDKNGNVINKKWYDSDDGLLENETNTYSGENLISKVWENYSESKLEGKLTFKYEKGNEIESTEFDFIDNTQKKWKCIYEYDYQNNWTKKITHTYKNEYYIVYRKIQYY